MIIKFLFTISYSLSVPTAYFHSHNGKTIGTLTLILSRRGRGRNREGKEGRGNKLEQGGKDLILSSILKTG